MSILKKNKVIFLKMILSLYLTFQTLQSCKNKSTNLNDKIVNPASKSKIQGSKPTVDSQATTGQQILNGDDNSKIVKNNQNELI